MHRTALAPALERRISGGPQFMASAVDDLLASPGISGVVSGRSPEALELLGLALNEVLYTIHEFAGEQGEGDASAIELWSESHLVVICVKFRGAALPSWLLANWDRAQEPALLAPPGDCGWGWLLVREALDSVTHSWCDDQQILFLERRV